MADMANHDQCCIVDTAYRWLKLLAQSTHALVDIVFRWMTLTLAYRCSYAMVDACRPLMMLPVVAQHWLHKALEPWLMLPDVER